MSIGLDPENWNLYQDQNDHWGLIQKVVFKILLNHIFCKFSKDHAKVTPSPEVLAPIPFIKQLVTAPNELAPFWLLHHLFEQLYGTR